MHAHELELELELEVFAEIQADLPRASLQEPTSPLVTQIDPIKDKP
jgi:hypothetical protein